MKLIIDCSVLWYKNWHKMKAKNYEAASGLELAEFSKNLAGDLFAYMKRFNPSECILGIDSREWRTEYYAAYFRDRVHYYKHRTKTNYWVVDVCDTLYIVHQDERTDTWRHKKATKDEQQTLDLLDADSWIFFEKGYTPAYILEAFPDTLKTVQESPEWEHLSKVYPTYKGGRNTTWNFETSYKQFKEHARGLTYNIANTLGVKAVAAEWAEFDDIAHAYVQMYKDEPMVIVTSDQDLDQLQAINPQLVTWNPGSGENNPARWVKLGPKLAQYHLFCKLIGGDSSDGIPPVTLQHEETKGRGKNKHTVYKNITYPVVQWSQDHTTAKKGQKTDKLVFKLSTGEMWKGEDKETTPATIDAWLREREVNGSYTRNVALMHLGAAPLQVQENCRKALLEAVPGEAKYTMADYLVTDTELRSLEHDALAMGREDREKGIFNPYQ